MAKPRRTSKSDPNLLATRQQLAVIFAVDPRTIAKWLDEGLPVAARGRGGKASLYPIPACVQWVVKRERARVTEEAKALSPAQERAALDRVRREELELKMQVRRGELVEVDQVAREFADAANAVKARLRRIPDAVADRLVAQASRGPAPVKALLLVEIDDALRELARTAEADVETAGAVA